MNAEKIDRAVSDSGTETRTIELDSTQPFALVLPRNSGSVTFYGADGQPAEVRVVGESGQRIAAHICFGMQRLPIEGISMRFMVSPTLAAC